MNQIPIRLALARNAGVSAREHNQAEQLLNEPARKVPPEKLLADLLKRECVRVMSSITECEAVQMPAHLARLDFLKELIELTLRHTLRESTEAVRSDRQLAHPFTLADYLACLILTRQNHRAPAFISARDEQLDKIFRGIDQLAGLIARDAGLVNFLMERGQL